MPNDLAACSGIYYGTHCPMRDGCQRFNVPRGNGQWFLDAPLYQLSGGGEWKCDEKVAAK